MWAVKKERKYKKDENGRLQHEIFPDGYPTNCEPRPTVVKFSYRMRARVKLVWS